MSEPTVTLERAQAMVPYWSDEAQRYNRLADAGSGEVARGHRLMAEDAREMAAAYQAVIDLAAARREVETVTRERDEARKLASLIEGSESRRTEERDDAEAIIARTRALVFAMPQESLEQAIERVNDGVLWLKDQHNQAMIALATARAALEDVRRVHTWLSADAYRKVAKGYNEAVAAYLPPSAMPITFRKTAAEAEDFPALGRVLAQEAGDGKV